MVKKKVLKKALKNKEVELLWWVVDGFVGFLALMIYSFLLYLLDAAGTGGVIAKMQDAVGYFGLNTFLDFNFTPGAMTLGILIVFAFSFVLGILIGQVVRSKRR
jgi:hypothetical protein